MRSKSKCPINGDDKVAILLKHELVKAQKLSSPNQKGGSAEEQEAEAAETEAEVTFEKRRSRRRGR